MPLHDLEKQLGAEMMPYGPAQPSQPAADIAATFGAYEAEYAAIRRHVAIMHQPQRGVVEVRGDDRADFLHRMVTNEVLALKPGDVRRSLLLNNKGRIVADLFVLHDEQRTLLDLDRLDADDLVSLLTDKLFSEDVILTNVSDNFARIALYGPAAMSLLQTLTPGTTGTPGPPGTVSDLEPMHHRAITIDGQSCVVCRRDETGTPGLHLMAPADAAADLYRKLLDAAGYEPGAQPDADFADRRRQSLRGRPIGWQAYNTARIEAGSPIFHIDFGGDSIPGETGILDETVSFTKGCYLGQEIVARMKNLGHPRRLLVGLKLPGDALPIAGSQVFDSRDRAAVIGGVTSSALSPVRGNLAIAFAVVRWGRHQPGTTVVVPAEGQLIEAQVQGLAFLEA